MKIRFLVPVLTAAALALSTPAAATDSSSSDPGQPAKAESKRYEVKTPHSNIKAGAAKVLVEAPSNVVKKVITDYRHYSSLSAKLEKVRVVGRSGANTDVYLQVPIAKGAARIWVVLRFEPPKVVDGEEVVEAHMLKGNVKRMDARWRIRKLDTNSTQLSLEMLIVPTVPLPGSFVTGEVAYVADVSVMGGRDRAEERWAARKK